MSYFMGEYTAEFKRRYEKELNAGRIRYSKSKLESISELRDILTKDRLEPYLGYNKKNVLTDLRRGLKGEKMKIRDILEMKKLYPEVYTKDYRYKKLGKQRTFKPISDPWLTEVKPNTPTKDLKVNKSGKQQLMLPPSKKPKKVKISKVRDGINDFINPKTNLNSKGLRGSSVFQNLNDDTLSMRVLRNKSRKASNTKVREIKVGERQLPKFNETINPKSSPKIKVISTSPPKFKPKSKLVNKYTLGAASLLGVGGLSYAGYKHLKNKNKKRK